jgi:hypothetical protein
MFIQIGTIPKPFVSVGIAGKGKKFSAGTGEIKSLAKWLPP